VTLEFYRKAKSNTDKKAFKKVRQDFEALLKHAEDNSRVRRKNPLLARVYGLLCARNRAFPTSQELTKVLPKPMAVTLKSVIRSRSAML